MDKFEALQRIAEENGGILQTKSALENGISRPTLGKFVREFQYEKVAQGIYCAPDSWPDGFYILQLRCPQIIFSHETALYLLDMTDREPMQYTVTVKTGYNPTQLSKDGIKVYTVKKELYEVGMTRLNTPFGHEVTAYNPERTLCDTIRSRSSIEMQVYQDAIRQYVKRKDRNLHVLMEYAKLFHVERYLDRYLEVLI